MTADARVNVWLVDNETDFVAKANAWLTVSGNGTEVELGPWQSNPKLKRREALFDLAEVLLGEIVRMRVLHAAEFMAAKNPDTVLASEVRQRHELMQENDDLGNQLQHAWQLIRDLQLELASANKRIERLEGCLVQVRAVVEKSE